MNRTARYFVCVALIFLVLVVNFFYLARISLRDNQAKDLSLQANKIFELIKDGDFTRAFALSNEKMVNIQVSMPAEKKLSEKIINFMPLSALNVLLPLLVILFLLISLYFFRLEKKYNSQK